MGDVQLELTEKEMRHLAEMSAMTLSVLGQAMPDTNDQRIDELQQLCVGILDAARGMPRIASDMELNPDCGYWFFKRTYCEDALYTELLDEFRDSNFWAELVSRSVDQYLDETVGHIQAERMSDAEREAATSSIQKALWSEVSRHGIERMGFLLPCDES